MNQEQQTLPYHKSERCFREYEGIIALAVDKQPEVFRFKPQGLKRQTTLIARLRDSIISYELNNWPSTAINRERFLQFRQHLVVRGWQNGDISIGQGANVTDQINFSHQHMQDVIQTPAGEQHPNVRMKPFVFETPLDPLQIHTLCTLSHARVLECPVKFQDASAPNDEWMLNLQEDYDIVVEKVEDEEGWWLIK